MKRWLFLFLLWPSVAMSATKWYTMKTGSDANPGTIGSPFLTIQKLVDSCNAPGDSGFIGPGEYDNAEGGSFGCDYEADANMYIHFSGTAGNPIAFRSMHDSAMPVICGSRGNFTRIGIFAEGESWITLDSLRVTNTHRGIYFEGSGSSGILTDTSDAAEGIVIQNCQIDSSYMHDACNCDNNGGILIAYCAWIKNITLRNNTIFAIGDWNGGGTKIYHANNQGVTTYRYIPPARITGNRISNTGTGIRVKTGLAAGAEIDSNWITDLNSGPGIHGLGQDLCNIHHNVIYDVPNEGIMIDSRNDGAPQGDVRKHKVWNNTIYQSDGAGIVYYGHADDSPPSNEGAYSDDSCFSNIVLNKNGTSREMGVLIEEITSCPAGQGEICNLFWDYNCTFDPGNTSPYRWYYSANFPTANNWSLLQLQNNTAHADNDIREYPGFLDTTISGGYDFNLDPLSTAATGGMGGDYPSYMGALDPNTNDCPVLALVGPADDTTIENYAINLIFTINDPDGDSVTYQLIGEAGDATPEDTLDEGYVLGDSTITFNWTGLVEDNQHYWYVRVCDTADCCDTLAITNFLVDSLPILDTSKWFVMKTGSDANPGTFSQPFLTIRRGIDSARAGDTLFIGPGEYEEAYGTPFPPHDYAWDAGTMYLRYGGNKADGKLTIRAMHDSTMPVVIGHRGYADRYAACTYMDSITIDSIHFKWGPRGIYLDGDNHLIQNCIIDSFYIGASVYSPDTNAASIDNNGGIFFNYTRYGSCEARNNHIFEIRARTNAAGTVLTPDKIVTSINNQGILTYFTPYDSLAPGTRITNNHIHGTFSGVRLKTGYASNIQVDSNHIHDTYQGITGYGADTARIEFNLIHDTEGEGIKIVLRGAVPGYPETFNTAVISHMVIRNNTIGRPGASAIQLAWDPWPVVSHPEFDSVMAFVACSVYNNISYSNNGSSRDWAILEKEIFSWDSTSYGVYNLYEDYNSWYDVGDPVLVRWYNPTVQNWTLAEYIAGTTHGNNDFDSDPQFVDPPNNDWRLLLGSPNEDTGRGSGAPTYRGALEPEQTIPPDVTSVEKTILSGTRIGF